MTQVFSMIPEDESPKRVTIKHNKTVKQKALARWHRTRIYALYLKGCDTCRRSWTLKLFKSPFAPLIITLFALFLACSCVVVGVKAEQWWLKEKVVTVPAIGVRTAKAAKVTEADIAKMTTEEYICWKFGKDCELALAVSKAENGTRQCDRFGVNTNKTIDFGVFQINTVHLKKGWTIAELIDCKKNVDYAYEIYQAQGFCPWVAYWNGSFKQFMDNPPKIKC